MSAAPSCLSLLTRRAVKGLTSILCSWTGGNRIPSSIPRGVSTCCCCLCLGCCIYHLWDGFGGFRESSQDKSHCHWGRGMCSQVLLAGDSCHFTVNSSKPVGARLHTWLGWWMTSEWGSCSPSNPWQSPSPDSALPPPNPPKTHHPLQRFFLSLFSPCLKSSSLRKAVTHLYSQLPAPRPAHSKVFLVMASPLQTFMRPLWDLTNACSFKTHAESSSHPWWQVWEDDRGVCLVLLPLTCHWQRQKEM